MDYRNSYLYQFKYAVYIWMQSKTKQFRQNSKLLFLETNDFINKTFSISINCILRENCCINKIFCTES